MTQEELFDMTTDNQAKFDCLLKGIKNAARRLVVELEYPDGCIELFENKAKNETNYQIHILELKRNVVSDNETRNKPTNDGEEDVVVRNSNGVRLNYHRTNILTFALTKPRSRFSGCVELRVGVSSYNSVEPPNAEIVKERWVARYDENGKRTDEKELARYDVLIRIDSEGLLPYLERLMRYRLMQYKSKESTYGCCHLYEKCSDARKCISKNKIHATVCAYKKNLDKGRIFYGRNRNI
jgi:hypothetical protein